MTLKMRQRVERSIARRVVLDALKAGYTLSVFDGEELTVKQSTSAKDVMAALMTTDEDHLLFSRHDDPPIKMLGGYGRPTFDGVSGWVRFVYGNDGWDVISDYTVNLEDVLKRAIQFADTWADN